MNPKYNAIIVEDNYSFALELEMIVKKLGHNILCTVDNSGDALVEILDKKPDLIFMDIDIKGKLSGIDIAEKIDHLKIPIIFLTSFNDEEHYDKTSSILNSTYIVKPADTFTIKSAIKLLMKVSYRVSLKVNNNSEVQVRENDIYLRKNDDYFRINKSHIVYVKADRVYCNTVLVDGTSFLNRISLNEYFDLLNSQSFIKPHRSYIVNKERISKLNLNENVIVIEDHNIPISRSAKLELKELLTIIK